MGKRYQEGLALKFQHEEKEKIVSELYKAVVQIGSEEECEQFFIDICTTKEIESLAQRLYVAKLLRKDVTYSEIERITGASTVTISRVSKALKNGPSGYKMILERLGE